MQVESESQEESLTRLTNRHLAKLLDIFDGINTPDIIKDATKRQFWFFSQDIKTQVLSKEQDNGLGKDQG